MKVPGGAFAAWRRYFAVALALMASLAIGGVGRSAWAADDLSVEAEHMAGGGKTYAAPSASNDKARLLYNNSGISRKVSGSIARVSVRAKGNPCGGAPQMEIRVDGRTVKAFLVTSRQAWTRYSAAVETAGGEHEISTGFVNDRLTRTCDRNLRIDKLRFELTDTLAPELPSQDGGPATNPFAGERFYADPDSDARRQAEEWRASRPGDARQMDKIASQPATYYFSEWTEQTRAGIAGKVDYRVSRVTEAGALPVLGAYAIPNRDCGEYSGGGFTTGAQYRDWVEGFARGIGDRKAVVVLEPDALGVTYCLSEAELRERLALMSYAVRVFGANPRTHVYIAAHATPPSAGDYRPVLGLMAERLEAAGVGEAEGFALNVSGFDRTEDMVGFGEALSAQVGGKHFVIDTSRNGLGPWGPGGPEAWCNPPGRALGPRPTADTGHRLVDAYYWLKWPGQSDGVCGGAPPAGTWMPEYALGLARRAAY